MERVIIPAISNDALVRRVILKCICHHFIAWDFFSKSWGDPIESPQSKAGETFIRRLEPKCYVISAFTENN